MTTEVTWSLESELRLAVDRGATWAAEFQDSGGQFRECGKELRAYYKAPLAFASSGNLAEGARCLEFIRQGLWNPVGGLASGEGDIKSRFLNFQRNFCDYMDGWVSIGAWLIGEYDFADDLCHRLLATRSTIHGAIRTGPEKWAGKRRYDILTNASAGRAFLITGRRSEALEIADFLTEVAAPRRQSNPEIRLDMSFDDRWKAVEAPNASERPYYCFDLTKRGERVFCPAFACSFLCDSWKISGRTDYLAAARFYFRFISETPEFKEGTLANGKSGWAAGMLALATGESAYLIAAQQIVPRVLARQSEDGEFGSRRRTTNEIPIEQRLETTCEQTAWMAQCLRMHALGVFCRPEATT